MSNERILCPIDFSPGSKRAAMHASELARALGAEIDLVHVYEVPMLVLPEGPVAVSPEALTTLVQKAEAALRGEAEALSAQGVAVATHLIQGAPARSIVEHAEKIGATMIVMGTHGRSGIKHLLLGSVAERVVRTASMPVLTLRASDDEPTRS